MHCTKTLGTAIRKFGGGKASVSKGSGLRIASKLPRNRVKERKKGRKSGSGERKKEGGTREGLGGEKKIP